MADEHDQQVRLPGSCLQDTYRLQLQQAGRSGWAKRCSWSKCCCTPHLAAPLACCCTPTLLLHPSPRADAD